MVGHAPLKASRGAVSRRLASFATFAVVGVFMALTLRGMDSTFLWGHDGYHGGAYGIRARHTLRTETFIPDETPGWARPTGHNYYLHEPILGHYIAIAGILALGDREIGVRVGYWLVTLLVLGLILALASQRDGVRGSLIAAIAFVSLPISYRVASLADCGMAGLAGLLAAAILYLRWLNTGRLRNGLFAALFLAVACEFEWSPFLGAAPLALHAIVLAWRRRGSSIVVAAALTAAPLFVAALHLVLVIRTGHRAEMLEGYHLRHQPWSVHTWTQLEGVMWEEAGPAHRGLFIIWMVSIVLRVRDRTIEPWLLPIASLLLALGAYLGLLAATVLIHPQRLLYLVAIVPLVLTDTVAAISVAFPNRPYIETLLAGAYAAISLPSGLQRWKEGRVPYELARFDRVALVVSIRDATSPGDIVDVHRSASEVHRRQELGWHLDRDIRTDAPIPEANEITPDNIVLVASPAALDATERAHWMDLAIHHPMHALGPLAWIDLRTAGASPACHLEFERSASFLGRWFQGPWGRPRLRCSATQ
jgi:hypothetical protein